jgi:hypothetical protein
LNILELDDAVVEEAAEVAAVRAFEVVAAGEFKVALTEAA